MPPVRPSSDPQGGNSDSQGGDLEGGDPDPDDAGEIVSELLGLRASVTHYTGTFRPGERINGTGTGMGTMTGIGGTTGGGVVVGKGRATWGVEGGGRGKREMGMGMGMGGGGVVVGVGVWVWVWVWGGF